MPILRLLKDSEASGEDIYHFTAEPNPFVKQGEKNLSYGRALLPLVANVQNLEIPCSRNFSSAQNRTSLRLMSAL